jgi:hypothetical protein
MNPMKANASHAWRVLNGIIFVTALVAPWKLVFSDIPPFGPFPIIGWKVVSSSISDGLSGIIVFFNCMGCIGSGLVAIGYLSLILYLVLNVLEVVLRGKSRHESLRKALMVCSITSSLFFLEIVLPPMQAPMQPALAWGYWLACVGLLSSLWLEVAEFISSKPLANESPPKAA